MTEKRVATRVEMRRARNGDVGSLQDLRNCRCEEWEAVQVVYWGEEAEVKL